MTDRLPIHNRPTRRAFSFAEVMFAVIILGVGFIMIAAMFPVAIRQSKSNADEASATALGRQASDIVDRLANNANMFPAPTSPASVFAIPSFEPLFFGSNVPSSGTQATFALWNSIRGDLISRDDPRYAWVPFYLRMPDPRITGKPQPFAQVTLICVQSTIKPTFDSTDALYPTGAPAPNLGRPSNLQGRPVSIRVAVGTAGDPNLIGFTKSASPTAYLGVATDAVAEGSFVIVRAATTASLSRLVGQIYRVGARRAEVDGTTYNGVNFTGAAGNMQVWELQPGYDFIPIPPDSVSGFAAIANIPASTEAWIVGRSFASNDPTKPITFDGPAMDVAAYTTFIYCKP